MIRLRDLLGVAIKYVLDYMYYKAGWRRLPRNIVLGASIFDEPAHESTAGTHLRSAARADSVVPQILQDQLSDSVIDDDGGAENPVTLGGQPAVMRHSAPSTPLASRKRTRDVSDDLTGDIGSLMTLREPYATNLQWFAILTD